MSRLHLVLPLIGLIAALCTLSRLLTQHVPHRISPIDRGLLANLSDIDFTSPSRSPGSHELYTSSATLDFCGAHGFRPFSSSAPRKIYDLIMVNTELDHLEIRLATLAHHVDHFVIVESPRTFQGGPKNLTVRAAWDRFRPWHDKIIYRELSFPPDWGHPERAWDWEDLQRDATYDQVMPFLRGPLAPALGDVLLVSDVDEVPRPETLLVLRSCDFPRRLTLSSRFYYYSFQWLHDGPEWPHPQATVYAGERTIRPSNLRNGDGGWPGLRGWEMAELGNAAWHCSSCFGSVEELLGKMGSFSHRWMNHEYFRDRGRIADAVRSGRDLWGRKGETFSRVEGNEDVPEVLRGGRFGYMLDRDGETAGFSDYP